MINRKNALFSLFSAAVALVFHSPLIELIRVSFASDYLSYIPLMPLISAYLLYAKRKSVFIDKKHSYAIGATVIGIGVVLYFIARNFQDQFSSNDYLSATTTSVLVLFFGGFLAFYGTRSFHEALFPLSFLIFTIPIPDTIIQKIILILQSGSAEVAYGIFQLFGVPIARDGFVFHLPTLSVEVAKQCSGIRSTLALFITSMLAGYLFLQTPWKRAVLAAAVFPITILKNGLRISVLSTLGAYVDERILSSALHRRGGILFFILALALMWIVLRALMKSEKNILSLQASSRVRNPTAKTGKPPSREERKGL